MTSSNFIAEAVQDDSDVLNTLIRQVSPDYVSSVVKLGKLCRKAQYVYIEYRGGTSNKIIGTFSVIYETKLAHRGCTVAHIEDVAILPEYQRKGYGKHMMQQALDMIKREGCRKAILSCNESNVGFYVSCGFRRHEITMRLDLQ